MTGEGKMFRQHCEKIDLGQHLKYTKAVHDEGLSLAVEIAEEIAYRDNVIMRQAKELAYIREQLDEARAELEAVERNDTYTERVL